MTGNKRTAGHATTDRPDSLRRLRFPIDRDRTPWSTAEVDAVTAALKVRLPQLVDVLAHVPSSSERDRRLAAMLAFTVDMEGEVS